jgi:N-acetylglutamate synthase-like GNAT family acetyltransferase
MIIIKEATEKDLPLIMALIKSERADGRKIFYNQFLIAKDGDEIIGCIRIKELENCLELGSLVIRPQYRNIGIGSKLIKKILARETRRPVYLLCRAQMSDFYSRGGFSEIDINFAPDALKNEYLLVRDEINEASGKIITMVNS